MTDSQAIDAIAELLQTEPWDTNLLSSVADLLEQVRPGVPDEDEETP